METKTYKCEYCDAILASSYSLKNHQQTSIKCLKIQEIPSGKYSCVICEKSLSCKKTLEAHMAECENGVLNIRIKKLEKEVERHKRIIEEKDLDIKGLEHQNMRLEKTIIEKDKKLVEFDKRIVKKNKCINELRFELHSRIQKEPSPKLQKRQPTTEKVIGKNGREQIMTTRYPFDESDSNEEEYDKNSTDYEFDNDD